MQPEQPAPIGGRFVLAGAGTQTPTGAAGPASDLQTGATVVVKLVAAEVLPTTAMADRALRELKQLGKVTSERIVRVIDQGKLPDGRIYVATERVEGSTTLEELIARRRAVVARARQSDRAADRRGTDRGAKGRRHPSRRRAAQRSRRAERSGQGRRLRSGRGGHRSSVRRPRLSCRPSRPRASRSISARTSTASARSTTSRSRARRPLPATLPA